MAISMISPTPVVNVKSVNGKTGEITLTASDVGAVPTSRTVNNKALNSNITLTAADVNAVPPSRTINNKALSANITLTASDVGAATASHDHNDLYLPLTGGTLTGNLTGKFITGTWLQTTLASDKAGDFATIDDSGWIYKRTPTQTLHDIGAALTHNNILDNGHFQVWQKYPTGYEGIPVVSSNNGAIGKYVVDRWRVQVSSSINTKLVPAYPCGIKNVSGGNCALSQTIPDASKYNGFTLTMSALKKMSDGTLQLFKETKAISGWKDNTNIITLFTTISDARWVKPGETLYGIKLEVGSQQTLAFPTIDGSWEFDVPNYYDELLKCQRYYYVQPNSEISYGFLTGSKKALNMQINLPVGMISLPEIIGMPTSSKISTVKGTSVEPTITSAKVNSSGYAGSPSMMLSLTSSTFDTNTEINNTPIVGYISGVVLSCEKETEYPYAD